jgi:L-asparagine transporter-like permease
MGLELLFLPYVLSAGIFAYLAKNANNNILEQFFMVVTVTFMFLGMAEAEAQGATFGTVGVTGMGLVLIVFFMLLFITLIWETVGRKMIEVVGGA